MDDEANVDIKSVQRILQGIPANISLTFHRAFDVSQDPWKTTESIRSLGFKRILTSGQEKSAALGTVFENLTKKWEVIKHAIDAIDAINAIDAILK